MCCIAQVYMRASYLNADSRPGPLIKTQLRPEESLKCPRCGEILIPNPWHSLLCQKIIDHRIGFWFNTRRVYSNARDGLAFQAQRRGEWRRRFWCNHFYIVVGEIKKWKKKWWDIFRVLLPGPNTQGQLHVIALLNDPYGQEIRSWAK